MRLHSHAAGRLELIVAEATQADSLRGVATATGQCDAAYRPYGRTPRLEVFTAERTWDSYDLLGFLKALPWSNRPRVVVLDNASLHTSAVMRRARQVLSASGIYLYDLPPYSPELNLLEPVFRQVNHQEIPQRSFTTRSDLRDAVESGFSNYRENLQSKSPK